MHEVFLDASLMNLGLFANFDLVEDPDADAFMGVGAFNLVRRSTLEEAGGFEELRMEIADDIGVAMLVHEQGGRGRVCAAFERVSVEWYSSLGEMIRGLEKNIFPAVGRFSYARTAALIVAGALVWTGPYVGLALEPLWVRSMCASAIGASLLFAPFVARLYEIRTLPLMLVPLGQLMNLWALARSAYLCWRRGGIEWRGTLYPLDRLREMQRVEL
jgi:hypothetical protein